MTEVGSAAEVAGNLGCFFISVFDHDSCCARHILEEATGTEQVIGFNQRPAEVGRMQSSMEVGSSAGYNIVFPRGHGLLLDCYFTQAAAV